MQIQHESFPLTGHPRRDAWYKNINLTSLIEKMENSGKGGVITTYAEPGTSFITQVIQQMQFNIKVIDTKDLGVMSMTHMDVFEGIEFYDAIVFDTREHIEEDVADAFVEIIEQKKMNTDSFQAIADNTVMKKPLPENIIFLVAAKGKDDYIVKKLRQLSK